MVCRTHHREKCRGPRCSRSRGQCRDFYRAPSRWATSPFWFRTLDSSWLSAVWGVAILQSAARDRLRSGVGQYLSGIGLAGRPERRPWLCLDEEKREEVCLWHGCVSGMELMRRRQLDLGCLLIIYQSLIIQSKSINHLEVSPSVSVVSWLASAVPQLLPFLTCSYGHVFFHCHPSSLGPSFEACTYNPDTPSTRIYKRTTMNQSNDFKFNYHKSWTTNPKVRIFRPKTEIISKGVVIIGTWCKTLSLSASII